ncbi:MAG: hypothetical protein A3G18_12295 [Rhodospirillales bacterium RIFCSPLOWO2_12_FULL_58_28]|nr:MAG: hypothetical protein A3H92_12310 [Rhodospirillales bacterium RIFCSPLOWO2_02_FULL_58_16]OHC79641.1 MAG: hypothetical protein A3G18_12295 [Rhodospirillales bacterium RIFCSPLOWO2_12_FULL_58_28]
MTTKLRPDELAVKGTGLGQLKTMRPYPSWEAVRTEIASARASTAGNTDIAAADKHSNNNAKHLF